MAQEPNLEVEVHGLVGEPRRPAARGRADTAHAWSLELPEEIEQTHDLHGRAREPGSDVVVATQTDPAEVAIRVLPGRLTVGRPARGPRLSCRPGG